MPLQISQFRLQNIDGFRVGMANTHRVTLFARLCQQQPELAANCLGIALVVQKDIPPRAGNAMLPGSTLGDRLMGGPAIDEKQLPTTGKCLHDPGHGPWVAG